MTEFPLINEIACENMLGENVRWHAQQEKFYWTDILSKRLYLWSPASNVLEVVNTPHRISSFAFIKDSSYLLVAYDKGLALFDPFTEIFRLLASLEGNLPLNRFNDGTCDKHGRYWLGSMNDSGLEPTPKTGALYCCDVIEGKLVVNKTLDEIAISNGLAFAPESDCLFFADSPSKKIHRYQTNKEHHKLTDEHLFTQTTLGVPDGATIDAQGNYWFANWAASCIQSVSPEGLTLFKAQIPAIQPTCIALGGPNMDLLCVTSAKAGLQNPKRDGNLFVYQLSEEIGLAPFYAKSDFLTVNSQQAEHC